MVDERLFVFFLTRKRGVRFQQILLISLEVNNKDWIWAVIFLARIHLKFQSSNRRRSSVISETQDARGELNEMEQTHVVAVQ
jgi:hypothetical protein